jgi:YidC/Oxa1 family membrane protein insertase
MSHGFFATIFYIPLYNALIFLINTVPGRSAGIAVILLTLIIRLILYPLSKKSIRTQLQMRQIEPEVQKIKEKVTDKQEQARQLMQLYKDKGVNPFAGLFLILLQFPILIGLYRVFRSGLPTVDPTLLYSFVHLPATVAMNFVGINLVYKSILLALITVITQFIQLNLALPTPKKGEDKSFKGDLAYSMNMQMKYIFPLVIFPIAYFSAVLALYLTTSNIFMILQELFVKRRLQKEYATIK